MHTTSSDSAHASLFYPEFITWRKVISDYEYN